MDRIVIVDQDDELIGSKTYAELRYEDYYRVSALWLKDSASDSVLLTQRKWTKHNDPGKWMAAVSGTVDEGETYEQNMVKEIEEEIGLTGLQLEKGPKQYVDDGEHKFFAQWFVSTVDKDDIKIVPQEEEVENYEWVSLETLKNDVIENSKKYVSSMQDSMRALGLL